MNVHDSEKLSNLLHHAGMDRVQDEASAELLIINTCSIRDKAENQLYSDLGKLRDWRAEQPGRLIGVGGCVAQQVGDRLLARFPHLDFVFGTHNLKLVPAMVSGARSGLRGVEIGESRSVDRFDLPAPSRPLGEADRCKAFVTVMEGCDMFCSFCIVPATRGREISRPASGILEEVKRLADSGVREVTLLGQTVNAYGRHDVKRGRAAESGTMAFAELLAKLDEISGIDRIRYTSPHPLFFDRALVEAHASLKSLCPHVHLPVQSGSDRILDAMRRRYGRDAYLEIAQSLRSAVPRITLTTDLIVGFPGETESDFDQTLDLMEKVGFEDSYSFIYSPRPGTAAAEMSGGLDRAEGRRRLDALQGLQRRLTMDYHRSRVGESTQVLVEGPSRHGAGQVCGRDPHHRVVNLVSDGSGGAGPIKPGDFVEVEIVEATPHSLLGEAVFAGAGSSASV